MYLYRFIVMRLKRCKGERGVSVACRKEAVHRVWRVACAVVMKCLRYLGDDVWVVVS